MTEARKPARRPAGPRSSKLEPSKAGLYRTGSSSAGLPKANASGGLSRAESPKVNAGASRPRSSVARKAPGTQGASTTASANHSTRRKASAGNAPARSSGRKSLPAVGKKAAATLPAKSGASSKARTRSAPERSTASLVKLVIAALEDMKAVNIQTLDVRGVTDIADIMIIASGNSDRHVRSIAEQVITAAKRAGRRPGGVEGKSDGEWVLVDLHDVVAHIMLPRVREFYRLESLWDVGSGQESRVGA